MEDQSTPGMELYKRSKFLEMLNDTASNPTEAETKKYTSEADKQIADTEASAMANYYSGMRQADTEIGSAGRSPQSVNQDNVLSEQVPMQKPVSNQYRDQLTAGLTPVSNNQLPSIQSNQAQTQQGLNERNFAPSEVSNAPTLNQLKEIPKQAVEIYPEAFKKPEIITDKYQSDRLAGLEEVKNEHVRSIEKASIGAPFLSQTKEFVDLTKDWEAAYSDLSKAVQGKDEALAKAKASQADDIMAKINKLGELEKNAGEKFKQDLDAIDQEVNKTRLWDDMPVGNKLVAAISLFAGAFTREGQNRALATLQGEIDKDIQNQKIEYERKGEKAKNAYAIASRFYSGEKERLAMAHAITNESLAAKAIELEAGIQPQKTKEAIEKFKLQLKMSSQANTSKAYKDYLDVKKAELEIVGKRQDIQDKENAKTVIGAGKALTPKGAEELGLATSKTVDALKVASGLQDTLSKVSRVGQYFTPYDKNRLSLEIQGIITTLKEAQQSAPGMRLPVSEVNKLSTIYENMSDRSKLAFYGPKFFIDEVERIKEEMKESLKQHYQQQGLAVPSSIIKNQTQARAR